MNIIKNKTVFQQKNSFAGDKKRRPANGTPKGPNEKVNQPTISRSRNC